MVKGYAIVRLATIKCHVRHYINEGHDAVNATQLRDAILSNSEVSGVRVALVDAGGVKHLKPIKMAKW